MVYYASRLSTQLCIDGGGRARVGARKFKKLSFLGGVVPFLNELFKVIDAVIAKARSEPSWQGDGSSAREGQLSHNEFVPC